MADDCYRFHSMDEGERIYKKWLLPVDGLSTDDPDLKAYVGRPVGNSPEMMPLDCSLNQDIHVAVDQHVIYTTSLPESDEPKFSTFCPHRGTSTYIRLWHPGEDGVAPSSERIVQDCNKILLAMKRIWDVRGIAVEGHGNRTGKRFFQSRTEQRGGPRRRDPTKDKIAVIHKDSNTAVAEMLDSVETNWEEEEQEEEEQEEEPQEENSD
jgi:hypothetical protein